MSLISTPAGIPVDELMIRAAAPSRFQIPFYSSLIRAGFPSPAESFVEKVCSLDDLCIANQEATYFVRATGDSMIGDQISEGDVLIVDCSREVVEDKIAVVWYNGEHTVKRLRYAKRLVILEPSNPAYEPIYVQPGEDFRVFGVVTFVIHQLR